MKTPSIPPSSVTQSEIALHLMINQLSVSTLPETIKNENTIVNEIPAEMYVYADMQKLAAIVGSLLNMMVRHSRNIALYISAKNYGNELRLFIKGHSGFNQPSFTSNLNKVQMLAQRIGCNVGVTSSVNNVSTVALSYYQH